MSDGCGPLGGHTGMELIAQEKGLLGSGSTLLPLRKAGGSKGRINAPVGARQG